MLFVCQSPPAYNHHLSWVSDGEGAAGKALQGPAIKQKLILTCAARGWQRRWAEIGRNLAIHHQTSDSDMCRAPVNTPRAATHSHIHTQASSSLPSALSQSAAVSSVANQWRGSLLEMLRGWGEGTVSKSYPVRQGYIKIHTALRHQTECWSCTGPILQQRSGKKREFFFFFGRYSLSHVPCIHITMKAHHGWEQQQQKGRIRKS